MIPSNYQFVNTPDELRAAIEALSQQPVVGFDTETTSLDPYAGRMRLVQLAAADGRVFVIDLDRFADGDAHRSDALAPLRQLLAVPRPIKVAHNAKFDAKWVKHQLGVELGGLFDTLLASQIVSAGETEDRHGLRVVVERYLGEAVDKTEQLSDWGGELSAAQLEYAARDAAVMLPLREKLIERLRADALVQVAQLEFECVMPVACLELAGIFLDAARWREQIAVVKQKRIALVEELQAMLAVGTVQGSLFANARADINLDSHTQLTAALKRLGVPVPDSTRNWKLQPLAKDYPVVATLLDYRTVQKSLTSYGENILEEINPVTGRIHANFHQIGAPTGRFACLTGDTLITTSRGFKRLDTVCAGDLVKTSYGPKRVLAAWANGVKEVYKLTLKDGRQIRATADHRFLTGRADTWRQLCELKAGDKVYVSLKAADENEAIELALHLTIPHVNNHKRVQMYLEKQVRPVEIAAIEKDGVEPVYDITVEAAHEFIANGIVVHNCTDPNIQQVPHAVEYRRCFRAPEGRKLVISDFSQIELRILADFTGDQGFVDAFNSGADLHRTTAAQVFNVSLEQVTKEQRDFAKRLNFGVVYGIGAQRFAMLTGLSVTEAEDLLRRYFATYRALDAWLRQAALKAVRERSARTASGRLARFNFDPADKQAVSLVQRNGKNTPVQGCLRRGTRILTVEHGYIPIEEAAHQEVTIWDGHKYVPALVLPSGHKRLVKLELWGGYYIECSPDHKFLTIDANGTRRWLKAEEITKLKQIYVDLTGHVPDWELPLNLKVFEPRDLKLNHQPVAKPHNAKTLSLEAFSDRFSLGLWAGRLASDGSVSPLDTKRPGNIVLMVAEHEEAILPELEALTGTFGYFGKRTRITETQPGAFHSLTVGSISLTRQLLYYGIKARVPDFLWRNKSALRGYLRGMFDGDGTVTNDGPVLTFGKGPDFHLDWARQIQQALLLFGVRSRINRCRDRINVRVLKRDTPTFATQIGFMNPAKQAKLVAIVPQAFVGDSHIYGRAARVKSVEITDERVEMYDVVNSTSKQFMANGLITHNSSADITKRALRLLHDRLRDTTACVVNVIHDEIVVETDAGQAAEIAQIVEDSMCKAGAEYVKKVPVKVETEIADEWVK